MRKLLLCTVIVTIATISVNAQIKKGSVFLGGDLSGSYQTSKNTGPNTQKNGGLTISPVLGVFTRDNFMVGGNLGFGFSNSKSGTDYTSKGSSYSAGVFVRQYKNLGTGGFYLFFQGELSGSYSTMKLESSLPADNSKQTNTTIGVSAYPGVSYAVSKRIHLETGFRNLVSLSYQKGKLETGDPLTTYSNTSGVSFGSSLSNATSSLFLGVRFLLGKS